MSSAAPPHAGPDAGPDTAADLSRAADTAERDGDLLGAIEILTNANRLRPDGAVETRLASLRRLAFDQLDRSSAHSTWPPARPADAPAPSGTIPEVALEDLTADLLRRHITTDGCLLVRRLADDAAVDQLVAGIDRALEEWAALEHPYYRATGSPWFEPLPVEEESLRSGLGRTWVTDSGGLLTADSPRVLFQLIELFEKVQLTQVVREYLGERPAFSANKCTMRRVPVDSDAGWHQDGAFLGRDIRALNVWLALTDCGRDAPGLDLVPRRIPEIVETGTHGAYFDWAVGSDLVEAIARETPIVRPEFNAGDVLLFDDLMLHRTAVDPAMTHSRHALETWCFAPSAYPEGHVPIVW